MSRSLAGPWADSPGASFMHVSSLNILICAPVLVVWGAVWLRARLWQRRRRARQAEWEALARHHSDLDRELDRVWYGR